VVAIFVLRWFCMESLGELVEPAGVIMLCILLVVKFRTMSWARSICVGSTWSCNSGWMFDNTVCIFSFVFFALNVFILRWRIWNGSSRFRSLFGCGCCCLFTLCCVVPRIDTNGGLKSILCPFFLIVAHIVCGVCIICLNSSSGEFLSSLIMAFVGCG
jgi:hypothetical protein